MARTPDRKPGTRKEEKIKFREVTSSQEVVDEPSQMAYHTDRGPTSEGGEFAMYDKLGLFNPRDGHTQEIIPEGDQHVVGKYRQAVLHDGYCEVDGDLILEGNLILEDI